MGLPASQLPETEAISVYVGAPFSTSASDLEARRRAMRLRSLSRNLAEWLAWTVGLGTLLAIVVASLATLR